MLCNVCKQNEAKVHLTKIVGDKMQKLDLCEDCSKEKGVDDPTNFSLTEVLLGKVTEEVAAMVQAEAAPEVGLKCPTCGYSQADFKKAGRFGCADCYATFGEGLETMLKTMHRAPGTLARSPPRSSNRVPKHRNSSSFKSVWKKPSRKKDLRKRPSCGMRSNG